MTFVFNILRRKISSLKWKYLAFFIYFFNSSMPKNKISAARLYFTVYFNGSSVKETCKQKHLGKLLNFKLDFQKHRKSQQRKRQIKQLLYYVNSRIFFRRSMLLTINTVAQLDRAGGEASPTLSWKSKKVSWFWKKGPHCIHLSVKIFHSKCSCNPIQDRRR